MKQKKGFSCCLIPPIRQFFFNPATAETWRIFEIMDGNQKFYDLSARKYAAEWYPNEMMLPSIKEFVSLLPTPDARVLDLGCGPGQESMRLSAEGVRVTGIDYSAESIKIAKEKNATIDFRLMSYDDIDESLGKFDGIFSCSSIIHLNETDLQKLLRNICNILKQDGVFLVIYRVGQGVITQLHTINGETVERTIVQYTKENLIDMFREEGYSFVQDGYLDPVLRPNWDCVIFRKEI